MNLVQKAKELATRKHGEINQVRKYTGEPYINHPAEVVSILKTVKHTEAMLCAGWAHDLLEDTNTTFSEIRDELGLDIAKLVRGLTDVSRHEDGNRELRKTLDREHLAVQMPCVMTVKLADLISNSNTILERDPKFAKVYIAEMKLLLDVLKDGNKTLWDKAYAIAYHNSI